MQSLAPTLVAYEGLALEGASFGLSADSQSKIDTVRRGGLESLAIMRDAGLPMAFGSDLLGQLHKYQSMEFSLRASVLTNREVLIQQHGFRRSFAAWKTKSALSSPVPMRIF
ncbi:hypothetical protein AB664_17700 [Brucella anthropi]|uniref:Amidohydrolase-related domain-containing protein n=1 Tax=Brucella anthropi TaxID=529 RepID=A0A656Z5W1_BRUAN|nr:hypothetical protein AB664_17700 [Brucella anthropi]